MALLREQLGQKDACLPDFARALHVLANHQSALGRLDEALGTSGEAVEAHRQLARQNRDAWLPALARSLNARALRQSDMGLREEALASALAAVELATEHVERGRVRDVGSDRAELGRMLNNLANRQGELGLHEAALVSARGAVTQLRALVARHGRAYLRELATGLQTLASRQHAAALPEEALASLEEAVVHWRALLAEAPDTGRLALAVALRALAHGRAVRGALDEARAAAIEATACLGPLVARHREQLAAEAAHTLYVRAEIETRRADLRVEQRPDQGGRLLRARDHRGRIRALAPVTLRLLTLALEASERSGTPLPPALLSFALDFDRRRRA